MDGEPLDVFIIPIKLDVQFETYGTTALMECVAAYGAGTGGSYTGGSAITPVNYNMLGLPTSKCTVKSNVDAAGSTYQTLRVGEFWRDGKNKVVDIATADDDSTDVKTKFTWRLVEEGVGPHITGLDGTNVGRLNVFAASQAGTGFITLVYAEFTAAEYGKYFT